MHMKIFSREKRFKSYVDLVTCVQSQKLPLQWGWWQAIQLLALRAYLVRRPPLKNTRFVDTHVGDGGAKYSYILTKMVSKKNTECAFFGTILLWSTLPHGRFQAVCIVSELSNTKLLLIVDWGIGLSANAASQWEWKCRRTSTMETQAGMQATQGERRMKKGATMPATGHPMNTRTRTHACGQCTRARALRLAAPT